MIFGLQPVSNSTSPLGCSIRKDGHGRSSTVSSPPCISKDVGAVKTGRGSARSLLALPAAMTLPKTGQINVRLALADSAELRVGGLIPAHYRSLVKRRATSDSSLDVAFQQDFGGAQILDLLIAAPQPFAQDIAIVLAQGRGLQRQI